MKAPAALLVLLSSCATVGEAPETAADLDPFGMLAKGYSERDGTVAALAYSPEATLEYRYDGAPATSERGREAIAASFQDFFDRLKDEATIDLNYRTTATLADGEQGVYRLRTGAMVEYGGYEVRYGADGLFVSDVSTSATRMEFEEAAGPVRLAPEAEDLDRAYYGALAGRYVLPGGCELVVTRSVVRLFVRNTCDQSWRGLERVSGREWLAGEKVLPGDQPQRLYRFAPIDDGASPELVMGHDAAAVTATRVERYTTSNVRFIADDGVELTGTIYHPGGDGPHPAIVLVHGSGPQDRDGYASIIAVLADALAAEGNMVLAYDKRGTGSSGGSSDGASFARLAGDATAGMKYLSRLTTVDAEDIGLAGSSQAGWVIAKAIEAGADPSRVILLGAAGAASPVTEQNLYNTRVRMTCAGIAADNIEAVLAQQKAFYDARRDPDARARLDALTRQARQNPAIAEWLFPDSAGLDEPGAWYNALEVDFDPLEIWRNFDGRIRFIFSEHDDSTDTATSVARLSSLDAEVVVLTDAMHLGLATRDICHGELSEVDRFSPKFFDALSRH